MAKETPTFKIPYPELPDDDNVPLSLKEIAERIEALFENVDLFQLRDGKPGYIIVCDSKGVPTYVPVTGDGTIDKAGTFQLGAGVVGTAELGDEAVAPEKLADGSVGSRKARLTSFDDSSSAEILLGTAYTVIPGIEVKIDLEVASYVHAFFSADLNVNPNGNNGANASVALQVDGTAQARTGRWGQGGVTQSWLDITIAQHLRLALPEGEHVLKLVAKRGSNPISALVPAGGAALSGFVTAQ
jgi:hypothetical protein